MATVNKKKISVLWKSSNPHWTTPKDLYNELDKEFTFNFDPCPNNPKFDGLAESWEGKRVFCNPPYGPGISKWLAKHTEPEVVVYLLPVRSDTRWWHDYGYKANMVWFVKGRLRFGDSKNSAPVPSVLFVFWSKEYARRRGLD